MRHRDRPVPQSATQTGLVCPNCKKRVAIVENQTPTVVVLWCRNCDHWWSAYEAAAKAH